MPLTRRSLFALDFGGRPRSGAWLRASRLAMGSRFEVTVAPEDSGYVDVARQGLEEAVRIDGQLGVHHEHSELSRINRFAGEDTVQATRPLFSLLQQCARLHVDTDGTFDVTLSPLSRCWARARREGRLPAPEELVAARALVGMPNVRLDPVTNGVRFGLSGMGMNLGSVAKGYAVGRIGDWLRECSVTHALVSAGGTSILALGGRDRGWVVDLHAPQGRARRRLARVFLKDGALATSALGERFVVVDGHRYGHVLDPRSGWPPRGVLSASVVTADATAADALATAFLVGGAELARRYCAEHTGTLAVLTLAGARSTTKVYGEYEGAEVLV